MILRMLIVLSTTTFAALAAGACGRSAASVCDDLCAKLEECGSTCSCDAGSYENCPNETQILDHLEGCAGKPCGEVGSCVLETPSCDGSSSQSGASVTSTSASSGSSGGGGTGNPCAELAQKCPSCTEQNLQTTCYAAVATGDSDSCQDGLDDPDIQSMCN